MALIELLVTVAATGNMRETDQFEYEYEYNADLFNTETLRVVHNQQFYWEPTQYVPPADYSRPIDQPIHAECLPDSHTKRTWFHDGSGGVATQDEENAASCGYTDPVEPPPPMQCEASYTFTIEPSRQARYILEFDELDGTTHRFVWDEAGYTGEPEYLCGSDEPAVLEWAGTGNKYDVLHGSSATITLTIVDDDNLLRNFYTADERKYRLTHYIEDKLNWRGWHMPDIYRSPWVSTRFHATVEAYDGIGALQNRPYLTPQGGRHYGRARGIDIIFRCLRLLDLDLPVWLAVNIWEDTTDLNVEPLSQVYFDQSGYYNEENEPLTCKEVLERVLQPYNAFIKQAAGALHILRYNEVQGPYMRRKATIGKGDTQVTFDEEVEAFEELVQILYDAEAEYREARQELTTKPAFKQVTTITHYGEYENLVLNGDFEQWNGNVPLLWEGPLPVYRVLEPKGEKFMMGFGLIRPFDVPMVERLTNKANPRPIRSDIGYAFSFDYTLLIDDFYDEKTVEWQVLPELNLTNGTLSVTNQFYNLPRVLIDGVEYELPNGTIQTNIPLAQPYHRRIDLVYTSGGGYTYVMGTESRVADLTPDLPAGAIVVTYIAYDEKEARFGSVYWGTFHYAEIRPVVKIGNFYLEGRAEAQEPRRALAWVQEEKSLWVQLENNAKYENGIHTITGKVTIHTQRLNTPGTLEVSFNAPQLYRDSTRGVSFAIDNVKFTERIAEEHIERVIVTGTNEGHINTEPFKLDLYHGSGLPRAQALITLQDGQPAGYFNNGKLLQENTARDILNQHSRALLVLSATTTAGISPISVVKDFNLYYNRFFMDKYVHYVRRNHVAFEAIEVLGGIDELPPQDAIITEDGRPIVTENYNWVVKEK